MYNETMKYCEACEDDTRHSMETEKPWEKSTGTTAFIAEMNGDLISRFECLTCGRLTEEM